MIKSAKYNESGSIDTVIDGFEMSVPADDFGNRHRIMLAEWEADGNIIEPYQAPPPDLPSYAAQKRWEKEVGGITVGGFEIASDDRSKLLISGARQGADNDPDFTTFFSFADGHSEVIDATQIIAISNALLAHVADVFRLYGIVMTGIISGVITTTEEIDAAFI